MTYTQLLQALNKPPLAPVYCIDGEEGFFLDRITSFFEEKLLQPAERDFNLHLLYGRDTTYQDVVNTCRRFPMFAERQVVILKEATQLKDVNELSAYVSAPSPTTVLLIEHRGKKLDKKTRLYKAVQKSAVYYTAEKLAESAVPVWIRGYGRDHGFSIGAREAERLTLLLGADLQKIVNEIDKVRLNVPDEKELTEALIKKYIGFSHEFSVFELPGLLVSGDTDKLATVLGTFLQSSKAAPHPLVTMSLFSFFSKVYNAHFTKNMKRNDAVSAIGWPRQAAEDAYDAAPKISLQQAENCLMIIAAYNNQSLGINSNTPDKELLKELCMKLLAALRSAQHTTA